MLFEFKLLLEEEVSILNISNYGCEECGYLCNLCKSINVWEIVVQKISSTPYSPVLSHVEMSLDFLLYLVDISTQ